MAATSVKSSYGQNRTSNDNTKGESKTTHYAYVLKRDADGNVTGKDFINDIQIYENEGKYGTFLKLRVTGNIPVGDMFVAKKRAK